MTWLGVDHSLVDVGPVVNVDTERVNVKHGFETTNCIKLKHELNPDFAG